MAQLVIYWTACQFEDTAAVNHDTAAWLLRQVDHLGR